MNRPKRIIILGSTGSIGSQALEVIAMHPESYEVLALAAWNEHEALLEQIKVFRPRYALLSEAQACSELKRQAPAGVDILCGTEQMESLASLPEADVVLVALSGAVGIKPTLAAIRQGARVALANKETLVAAGDVVMREVRQRQTELIPVDSEHSAIFQCIRDEGRFLENIWLTASGGPFFSSTVEELEAVTPELALCHPNWAMGPKITIDSATLMNKGLEVIEAHHLFQLGYDKIKVVVQRESVIHSMTEFVDGSFLAHLGAADMRIPIQYAFSYPERQVSPARHLDFRTLGTLQFARPDTERFPALALAFEAGRAGGTMPAVLNAANEIAVGLFMEGRLGFTGIPALVRNVMDRHSIEKADSLESVLEADAWARQLSNEIISKGLLKI